MGFDEQIFRLILNSNHSFRYVCAHPDNVLETVIGTEAYNHIVDDGAYIGCFGINHWNDFTHINWGNHDCKGLSDTLKTKCLSGFVVKFGYGDTGKCNNVSTIQIKDSSDQLFGEYKLSKFVPNDGEYSSMTYIYDIGDLYYIMTITESGTRVVGDPSKIYNLRERNVDLMGIYHDEFGIPLPKLQEFHTSDSVYFTNNRLVNIDGVLETNTYGCIVCENKNPNKDNNLVVVDVKEIIPNESTSNRCSVSLIGTGKVSKYLNGFLDPYTKEQQFATTGFERIPRSIIETARNVLNNN